MPYGIPKDKGGDSPENVKRMESCIAQVQKRGESKLSAILICKKSLGFTK